VDSPRGSRGILRYAFRISVGLPVVAAAATVRGGVVSSYTVSGESVHEGMSAEQLRKIAGDPLAAEEVDGKGIRM
jgi:hypothetical protein